MSLIGTNIKKIRGVKGLSQTSFANLFGLTRANIGSYEEQRAEPKLDVILKIADYYKIEIGKLVTKELTVNEISNFNLLEKVVESKSIVSKGVEVLFVSKQFIKKYPSERYDKSFVANLSTLTLPFLVSNNEMLAIYNEGNELYFDNHGFLHGDILFLEKQKVSESNGLFLGVVIDDEIIAKGLVGINSDSVKITPTNPNFGSVTVELNKTVTIWKITGRYTENILSKAFLVAKINALEKR